MTAATRVEELVTRLLDQFDVAGVTAGSLLRGAIRIASMREDWEDLLWLEREQIGINAPEATERITLKLAPHFEREAYKKIWTDISESIVAERAIRGFDANGLISNDKQMIIQFGMDTLEEKAESLKSDIAAAVPPSGLHPIDLYHKSTENTRIRLMLTAPRRHPFGYISYSHSHSRVS